MNTEIRIVPATQQHGEAMIALLPELANFDIPERRQPEHLWQGDRELLEQWLAGTRPECFGFVASTDINDVAAYIFVSMREELLSHAPSAHIEIVVVAPDSRRGGLAQKLCQVAEDEARRRGAETITLHVFARNARARALYARIGYDEELLRCIKDL